MDSAGDLVTATFSIVMGWRGLTVRYVYGYPSDAICVWFLESFKTLKTRRPFLVIGSSDNRHRDSCPSSDCLGRASEKRTVDAFAAVAAHVDLVNAIVVSVFQDSPCGFADFSDSIAGLTNPVRTMSSVRPLQPMACCCRSGPC